MWHQCVTHQAFSYHTANILIILKNVDMSWKQIFSWSPERNSSKFVAIGTQSLIHNDLKLQSALKPTLGPTLITDNLQPTLFFKYLVFKEQSTSSFNSISKRLLFVNNYFILFKKRLSGISKQILYINLVLLCLSAFLW